MSSVRSHTSPQSRGLRRLRRRPRRCSTASVTTPGSPPRRPSAPTRPSPSPAWSAPSTRGRPRLPLRPSTPSPAGAAPSSVTTWASARPHVLLALAAERIRRTGRPRHHGRPPGGRGRLHHRPARPASRTSAWCTVKGHKRMPTCPTPTSTSSATTPARCRRGSPTGHRRQRQGCTTSPRRGRSPHRSSPATRFTATRATAASPPAAPRSCSLSASTAARSARPSSAPPARCSPTARSRRTSRCRSSAARQLVKAVTPGASAMSGYLWRYCAPVQGRAKRRAPVHDVRRHRHRREALKLHECLRRTVYVRREKSDLGEGVLPHGGWNVVPLALPDGTMRRYQRIEKDFYNLCTEERGKVWADKVPPRRRPSSRWACCAKRPAWPRPRLPPTTSLTSSRRASRSWRSTTTSVCGRNWPSHCSARASSIVIINGSVTGDDRIEAIDDFQAGDGSGVPRSDQGRRHGRHAHRSVRRRVRPVRLVGRRPRSSAADRILRADAITHRLAADGGEGVTWHVLQAHYADGDPTFDAMIFNVLEQKAAVCDAVNAGRPVTMDSESVMYECLISWTPSGKRHGGW